jgi:hypothetical protein
LVLVGGISAQETDRSDDRLAIFISDLHMGLGKDEAGAWFPTEDFRWPAALEGFLDHISSEGRDAVDLVIVGDFLELWQTPTRSRGFRAAWIELPACDSRQSRRCPTDRWDLGNSGIRFGGGAGLCAASDLRHLDLERWTGGG